MTRGAMAAASEAGGARAAGAVRSGTAPAPAPAVELRGVSKRFGSTIALHEIDLSIAKGEFFSLLGPSGCGKTTTLNLIGGFESASGGTLLIDGRPVHDIPPYRRPVNTVFQSYALFPHMNVAENVGFGLRMKQVPRAERERAVAEMLRLVSLEGYEDRRPGQLSGGQRQRVALARALVNRPSVLLLDEPLGALDLKLRKQMQAELTRIQRQVGITFVYVTHDQEEALAMSDRIAVMDHGRLLQVGTPAEIYDAPASRAVMEFIGSANAFAGRIAGAAPAVSSGAAPTGGSGGATSATAGIAAVDLDGLGRVFARADPALTVGARVTLMVRPERMRIGAGQRSSNAAALAGTVVKLAHLGFVTHVTVRLHDACEVLVFRLHDVDTDDTDTLAEGQRVFLWWDASDARMFPADAHFQTGGTPQAASADLRGDGHGEAFGPT
jgi:spermidine/putrescine transport system ATP-binding protein